MKNSRARTRGSATITALVILTPVLIAGGSLIGAMSNVGREIEQCIGESGACSVAASGAHVALASLAVGDWDFGVTRLEIGGGVAVVSILDVSADGVDDDDNGLVDDDGEADLVGLRSEGWINVEIDEKGDCVSKGRRWYRSVVRATVQVGDRISLPEIPLFFASAAPMVSLDGVDFPSPFDFTTNTSDPVLVQSPQDSGSGERLYSDSTRSCQLSSYETLLSASDAELSSTFCADSTTLSVSDHPMIPALLDFQARDPEYHATVDLDAIEQKLCQGNLEMLPEPELVDPSFSGPSSQVYVAGSDLTIRGTCHGSGILLVNGDLHVTADFDFEGLVIVRGRMEFDAPSGSHGRLRGGLWISSENELSSTLSATGEVVVEHDPELVRSLIRSAAGLGGADEDVRLIAWTQDSVGDRGY